MKKFFLTMTMVAVFGIATAQTEQGGWLIGASTNLGFTSTSVDGVDDNESEFNLDGKAGYFLIDGLAAGLNLSFSNNKQGDDKTTVTAIGPFARYYVNGTFFVGAGYASTSVKSDDGTTSNTVKGGLLSLEAGYPIWFGDNVALEPSLNYGMGSGDLLKDTSFFGLAVGFSLYF
ncbi:MAG: outer membrane beta-barrel protein [Cyclobacteriaceae bacterium]